MLKTITPEIHKELERIGFEENEISTFQMIHELKTREYSIDIKELINKSAFYNLSKGIAETFEKNNWSEEDFFEIIQKYRNERKK